MAKTPTDIRSLARAHTEAAIKTLAGIMNQPDAPSAARVSAATSLLDRGWGKPDSKTEITVIRKPAELTDAEIAERIAEIRGADALDGAAGAPIDPSQLN